MDINYGWLRDHANTKFAPNTLSSLIYNKEGLLHNVDEGLYLNKEVLTKAELENFLSVNDLFYPTNSDKSSVYKIKDGSYVCFTHEKS